MVNIKIPKELIEEIQENFVEMGYEVIDRQRLIINMIRQYLDNGIEPDLDCLEAENIIILNDLRNEPKDNIGE